METSRNTTDSKEAYAYLIDPLTAPDPSDETGPNAHFRSTFAPVSPLPSPPKSASPVVQETKIETNPFRRSASLRSPPQSPNHARQSYPTPPTSASPRRAHFDTDYRSAAFGGYTAEQKPRRYSDAHSRQSPPQGRALPTRGGSLRQRYPGDKSHRPLEMLTQEAEAANRSPHLRKKHLPTADVIDQLDATTVGGAYHHEGPYDAALPARNTNFANSPVAAVADSNMEALKATPKEKIIDSIQRGVPLSGTAAVPPGEVDRSGNLYEYEEGENMMIADGGNYKRWPGVEYAEGDMKGKGEPEFSTEHDNKGSHSRHASIGDGVEEYEMGRTSSVRRHESISKRATEGIKRRIGSLRKKEQE